jgi:hypothetical protein
MSTASAKSLFSRLKEFMIPKPVVSYRLALNWVGREKDTELQDQRSPYCITAI